MLTPVMASQWLSEAMKLKAKYADFQKRMTALKAANIDPVKYPELAKERLALIERGNKIEQNVRSTIASVERAYSYVQNLPSNIMSAGEAIIEKIGSSAGGAWDWFKSTTGLNGLGAIPVIVAVGVIAAAVASITYWITDSINFQAKIAEQKRLEAKGYTSEQASKIVAKISGNTFTRLVDNLGTVGKLGAVAGILFGGYKLLETYRKVK